MNEALTLLGKSGVTKPARLLETFKSPGVRTVSFETGEVYSRCPVTGQPDFSEVNITYQPEELCVESKSLKLFLQAFADTAMFVEAMAVHIATHVAESTGASLVRVQVTQGVRGGIETGAMHEIIVAESTRLYREATGAHREPGVVFATVTEKLEMIGESK